MRFLVIVFFLFTSLTCFGQMSRDTEPTVPAYFFIPSPDSLDYRLEARVYLATYTKVKTYHLTQTCQALKKEKQTLIALPESEAKQKSFLTACPKCNKK